MKYIVSLMLCLLVVSAAYADGRGELRLTGAVRRAMASGGEKRVWALVLDFETALDGKIFKVIELDPGNKDINKYKDRHVEITGTLTRKTVAGRGGYTVLTVKSIRKAE